MKSEKPGGSTSVVEVTHFSEHLFWPDLDVDLAVDSIHHPERYPLVSRVESNKPLQRSVGAGKVREKADGKRRAARR
jgi:hypothetical protein